MQWFWTAAGGQDQICHLTTNPPAYTSTVLVSITRYQLSLLSMWRKHKTASKTTIKVLPKLKLNILLQTCGSSLSSKRFEIYILFTTLFWYSWECLDCFQICIELHTNSKFWWCHVWPPPPVLETAPVILRKCYKFQVSYTTHVGSMLSIT